MSRIHGGLVGAVLALGGSIYLAFFTNPLTGLLTFLTSVVYLAAYTPLKKISPVCTFVGAFPGAMPGVLGWTAACGRLDWGTLALFGILFLWQFPHFFAIAWMYREDYALAGIQMLPVVEPDGASTSRQILIYSVLLVPVSLLPSWLGMTGALYTVGALALGLFFLYAGIRVSLDHTRIRARKVLLASVVYLPVLYGLMLIDPIRL